jgi:multisubunit Na+/H+ antiporter MnhB subunit
MKERRITVPELAIFALTRAMIGFGAGLLLAPRFVRDRRPGVGKTLLAIGALSTIPIAMRMLRERRRVAGIADTQSSDAPAMGYPSGQNVAYAPNDINDVDVVMVVSAEP